MMDEVDWNETVTLMEREDSGSDYYIGFQQRGCGRLRDIVRQAVIAPEDQQGRFILERPGRPNLDIHQIIALSQRPDFPKD
jgi:hypothetical protein